MAYSITTANGHYNLLSQLRTFVTGLGWAELLADTGSADHIVIWKAPGYSGAESIYVGIKTWQDFKTDSVGFEVFGLTFYQDGVPYNSQLGFNSLFVPLWQQTMDYCVVANAQRLVVVAQIGLTDQSFYIGKFFPYTTPDIYSYPLVVSGMMPLINQYNFVLSMRHSCVENHISSSYYSYVAGFMGLVDYEFYSNLLMLKPNGAWIQADVWPKTYPELYRPTNADSSNAAGDYTFYPLTLYKETSRVFNAIDTGSEVTQYFGDIYGELDGIFHVTGFNMTPRGVITADAKLYYIFRSGSSSRLDSFFAMELH